MSVERDQDEMDVLSDSECRQKLASQVVGRIGIIVDQYPLIIPVNYAMDGDAVVIHTALGTVVARADQANVTFEVDHFDVERKVGWSVLLRGRGAAVEDHESADATPTESAGVVAPWAPGERPVRIRISPLEVSGRRINPSEEFEWRLGTAAYM